jgi:hypothetical protein
MSDTKTLLNIIARGVSDPIEISKALPNWGLITLGSALFQLLQNDWIVVDQEGNFLVNT